MKRWCAWVTLKSKEIKGGGGWTCSKEALLKRHTSLKHLLVVVLWALWCRERKRERGKKPLSFWQNNPLTVSKRRESFVPSQAKSLSTCANYFENIPVCVSFFYSRRATHTHTHAYACMQCGCKVTPSIDKSPSCDSLLTAQTNIKLDGGEQKTIKRPFSWHFYSITARLLTTAPAAVSSSSFPIW